MKHDSNCKIVSKQGRMTEGKKKFCSPMPMVNVSISGCNKSNHALPISVFQVGWGPLFSGWGARGCCRCQFNPPCGGPKLHKTTPPNHQNIPKNAGNFINLQLLGEPWEIHSMNRMATRRHSSSTIATLKRTYGMSNPGSQYRMLSDRSRNLLP